MNNLFNKGRIAKLLGFACLAGLAPFAAADNVTFGFGNITNNDVNDAAAGESQLSVTVSNDGLGVGQVNFIFRNAGSEAMSITDVFFDDGTLLGIASITNTPGLVEFSQGGSPPDLPGGNGIGFETTAGFLADSVPPAQPNGVNPGEELQDLAEVKE